VIAKNREVRERERDQLAQIESRFVAATLEQLLDRSRGHVYLLLFRGEVVYVGQSLNIESRIQGHLGRGDKLFDRALWIEVAAEDMDAYEGALIRAFSPKLNGRRVPKNEARDREVLAKLGIGVGLKAVP
jgi:hypothetical protein